MSASAERRYIGIISDEARGVGPTLTRLALTVVEPLYRAATAARNATFDMGLRSIRRVDRPIVCVGNLTTGGTGKTPVVAWLADALRRSLGAEIGILIRGYKASNGNSDEASLLHALLDDTSSPQAHILVGADRLANARRAIAEHPGIRAFVMDDGFQHRQLHRDCDLVLIDATNPFGFDHVLPRGLLRESSKGLKRAHSVLITRADQVSPHALAHLRRKIARLNPTASLLSCSHAITSFRAGDGTRVAVDELRGTPVVAFAGIGNPESFAASLERAGCIVAGKQWYGDHHHLTLDDIANIRTLVREAGADAIVTTTKDRIKLSPTVPPELAPLFVAEIKVQFANDDARELLALIMNRL